MYPNLKCYRACKYGLQQYKDIWIFQLYIIVLNLLTKVVKADSGSVFKYYTRLRLKFFMNYFCNCELVMRFMSKILICIVKNLLLLCWIGVWVSFGIWNLWILIIVQMFRDTNKRRQCSKTILNEPLKFE